MARCLVVLAMLGSVAAAAPLPDGMELGVSEVNDSRDEVLVAVGQDMAILESGNTVGFSMTRGGVRVTRENGCDLQTVTLFTIDELRSRIASVRARRLHEAGDEVEAVAEARRAVTLDPRRRDAAFDLAALQLAVAPRRTALATLGRWLASQRVATYLRIALTPELAGLGGAPELQPARAATPSTLVVAATDPTFALSPDHRVFAVVHPVETRERPAALELLDTRSGLVLESVPLDTSDQRAVAATLLRDLGFTAVAPVTAHPRLRAAVRARTASHGFQGTVNDAVYFPGAGLVELSIGHACLGSDVISTAWIATGPSRAGT